jgi:hypothetical protein
MIPTPEPNIAACTSLLERWIAPHQDPRGGSWLDEKRTHIAGGAPRRVFYTAFSAVPRFIPRAALSLTDADLAAADAACPGWNPAAWSTDQAARSLLLLTFSPDDPDAYTNALWQLVTTADVAESVALYQSLPLLPHRERFREQAKEGLRTNMTSVFNAVALRNPYPAAAFEENAWNQMVLKAVFVGSPLHEIEGLDARANATLARMLIDYAHERWAASRTVTPELWRPVGPVAGPEAQPDLERVLTDADAVLQEAGALALAQSPAPAAADLLARRPDLRQRIASGVLTWDRFSENRLTAAS